MLRSTESYRDRNPVTGEDGYVKGMCLTGGPEFRICANRCKQWWATFNLMIYVLIVPIESLSFSQFVSSIFPKFFRLFLFLALFSDVSGQIIPLRPSNSIVHHLLLGKSYLLFVLASETNRISIVPRSSAHRQNPTRALKWKIVPGTGVGGVSCCSTMFGLSKSGPGGWGCRLFVVRSWYQTLGFPFIKRGYKNQKPKIHLHWALFYGTQKENANI